MKRQAIIWANADPLDWCIYVAQGGDELQNKQYTCPISIVV